MVVLVALRLRVSRVMAVTVVQQALLVLGVHHSAVQRSVARAVTALQVE
jgi:hypothetical protein